jgi:hypothetical protein
LKLILADKPPPEMANILPMDIDMAAGAMREKENTTFALGAWA